MSATFRYDEFGHLMTPVDVFGRTFWGHVHEEQAMSCAYFERLGWPQDQ